MKTRKKYLEFNHLKYLKFNIVQHYIEKKLGNN